MEGFQNKKSQMIGIGIITVLMIAVIVYILKDESLENIVNTMLSIKPVFILIAVTLMIFYILCEGVNIWIVMKALKKDVNLLNCLGYGFVGFYFSSITPSSSGGQPAQIFIMKKDGLSMTSSSLSLMVLLFSHQLVIIVMGILAFFFVPDFSTTYQTGFKLLLIYGFGSNSVILIGILLLIFSPNIVFSILNFFGILVYKLRLVKNRDSIKKKIESSIVEYERGAAYMRNNLNVIVKVTIVTFFQILAMFSIPFVIYYAFGLSKYSYFDIVLVQAVLNISVSSLPLPGSVGASESVFLDMFKGFFGNFVIPGMLLTRIANFYIVLIISGVISLLMYFRKNNEMPGGVESQ